MPKIGIIGGSGLDDPQILKEPQIKETGTEFGRPSSALTIGKIEGVEVVILARHGQDHSIMPTKVNFSGYSGGFAARRNQARQFGFSQSVYWFYPPSQFNFFYRQGCSYANVRALW